MLNYSSPALDAELAYRRELAMLAGKGTRSPASAPPLAAAVALTAAPLSRPVSGPGRPGVPAMIDAVPR